LEEAELKLRSQESTVAETNSMALDVETPIRPVVSEQAVMTDPDADVEIARRVSEL
jgi:hypothetical protein